jgi:hypothetical protein
MDSPTARFLHQLNRPPCVRAAATLTPGKSLRIGDNLAARIAGRFARCAVQRPLDRVLAIPQPGSWVQYVEGSTALTFAPRVSLSLGAAAHRLGARTIERESRFEERVERTVQFDRLVERLATRVERIDTLRGERVVVLERVPSPVIEPRASPINARALAAASPHRVERILRAQIASAPAPTQEETRASAPREGDRPRPRSPASAPEPGPRVQPFDVEQLADRVVRVIDRRLTASRERLGRI